MSINKQAVARELSGCVALGEQAPVGARTAERMRVPQLAPTVYRPANAMPPVAMCTRSAGR